MPIPGNCSNTYFPDFHKPGKDLPTPFQASVIVVTCAVAKSVFCQQFTINTINTSYQWYNIIIQQTLHNSGVVISEQQPVITNLETMCTQLC